MATKTARTGTAPFAHLLSLVTGKAPKGAEDEHDEMDAEEEDDAPQGEEDKPDEGAETDRDEENAEDGNGDDGDKKGRKAKGKKASGKAEQDDDCEDKAESDDDDEEMAQARREGFAAAQARGRRIFGAASAALRPDMAAHLAFNDTMPSAQAIAMLDMAANGVAPTGNGGRLHRRMSRVTVPTPGASGGKASPKSDVDSFVEMAKSAAEKAGIR